MACIRYRSIWAGWWIISGMLGMISMGLAQDDSWAIVDNMPTPRAAFSTSVVDDIIYVMGGDTGLAGGGGTNIVEAYDPLTKIWTRKADMLVSRVVFSTSVVNGKIYAIGGLTGQGTAGKLSLVEVYDPGTDSWSQAAAMPTARWGFSTSVVNNMIYAIGGVTDHPTTVPTVEVYNPATDSWSVAASLPSARVALVTVAVNGKIYALGGSLDSFPYSFVVPGVEEYDPAKDIWTSKPSLSIARSFLSASVWKGQIYTFGGLTGDITLSTIAAEVETYKPDSTITSVSINPAGNRVRSFTLHQNYPNPFNPTTTIKYTLISSARVNLSVYTLNGQRIRSFILDLIPGHRNSQPEIYTRIRARSIF